MVVVVFSIYATAWGFRTHQPRFFWPVAEAVFVAFAIALVVGPLAAPRVAHDVGLVGGQLYFALVIAVLSVIVVGLRMRRAGEGDAGAGHGNGAGQDDAEGEHG